MKQKVLVIVGPTASGKSALAVVLAKVFNGEVISADSRQVYTGLDIGTGKITKREMGGLTHHLLDVASPKKDFSAGDFLRLGSKAIADINRRRKLPVIVGGTGYYIDALVGRIMLPDVVPDEKFRASLSKKNPAQLFALLKKADPRRASSMSTPSERNNRVRLIRALEIAQAIGKSPSPKVSPSYDVLWVGIRPPLEELGRKISARLHSRIRRGMIAEARRLHAAGLSYKRMEALGLEYRSLARFLQKKISKNEMESELQRDIRRYAKKQLAYWKRNPDITWYKPKDKTRIPAAVRTWLRK
ncbi:tRNA (adenosine(37)-N6)-dimethylallyltransferase MiaA [Candidatus Kaiserbacteria bacterium]|nr:tRNA (adenosine(37)-N6)-dimethylallyltransferase MiaA [Candidatus Kaiserbacteria bacterium]